MEQDQDSRSNLQSGQANEPGNALWQVLDEWQAPVPDDAFSARVLERIRQEDRVPASRGWRNTGWRNLWASWMPSGRAWAVSAALASVLLAVVLLRQPADLSVAPLEGNGEFSAQQVETALEDLRMLEELYSFVSHDGLAGEDGFSRQEESESNRI